jgi:NAD(P)-dependent dehydrogenase (short-subunit alcohol dehydrogenase family)
MDKGTVLVTGGTKRIGAAIAERLRNAGWRVLTSSHRGDAQADFVADFTDASGAVKLYSEVLKAAPDLCAIVNNAALFNAEDDVLRAVNLTAPQKLTMLLAGREGVQCAVVNILDSQTLDETPSENDTVYRRTKRELLAYTRKSACLFAGTLRVNAVAPGAVLPPEGCHEKAGESLLDRRPSPEDVADAVLYLLGAKSVTGTVIPVDAGQHLIF